MRPHILPLTRAARPYGQDLLFGSPFPVSEANVVGKGTGGLGPIAYAV
jgi:hypothetical protein